MSSRLATTLCGISLKAPVLAASGTYAYGVEFKKLTDLSAIGGIVVKGLSREAMEGNPPPRVVETEGGMVNSIGLQNIGVRAFVAEKLPALRGSGTAIFANVFGYAVEDYVEVVRVLEDAEGIAGYELNVSCPNTKHGGIFFSNDPALLGELVGAVRAKCRRPLIVKLSPNVTSIAKMAKVAADAGADALSLVNTFLAMSIDVETRKPRLSNVTGGLSGPAIKPIALRMVYEVAHTVSIPVIGMGGIVTPEDAVEFLLAGATAVQVGTASFADPRAVERIAGGLESWCRTHHVERVASLTGALDAPRG